MVSQNSKLKGLLSLRHHPDEHPFLLRIGRRSNLTKMDNEYCVYIMTNKWNSVLYTGVANNLRRRIQEHKDKFNQGFTQRYNINKLVYYEVTESIESAILREKQIKGGSRRDKVSLVNSFNKCWRDLYEEI